MLGGVEFKPTYAVELFFDAALDSRIRAAWAALEEAGCPSLATHTHRKHRPHVSLAVLSDMEGLDWTQVRRVLPALPALTFSSVGAFPGPEVVVFLAPVVSRELLALHEAFHEALPPGIQVSPYYLREYWVPHCTAAQGLASVQLGQALEVLRDFVPLAGRVASMGYTRIGSGEITLL